MHLKIQSFIYTSTVCTTQHMLYSIVNIESKEKLFNLENVFF